MTDVAVKGLDLYCLEGKNWYFVNSARPTGKVRNLASLAVWKLKNGSL